MKGTPINPKRVALVAMLLIACGPGATAQAPAAAASVRILSPASAAQLEGDNVQVSLEVQGFTLAPLGSAKKSGEGHIHLKLDGQLQMIDKPTFTYRASLRHSRRGRARYQRSLVALASVSSDSACYDDAGRVPTSPRVNCGTLVRLQLLNAGDGLILTLASFKRLRHRDTTPTALSIPIPLSQLTAPPCSDSAIAGSPLSS
jgi:hypothetical protein